MNGMEEIVFKEALGSVLQPVIGIQNWYSMMEVEGEKFSSLDAYDAGIIFRREGHCPGMNHILISWNKEVHRPFRMEHSICVGAPIFFEGLFYFFRLNFTTNRCEIWTYDPNEREKEKIDEFSFDPIEDTYNISWGGNPIILWSNHEEFHTLWPQRKRYCDVQGNFVDRNHDVLYFRDFIEVNDLYYENVNVYDFETGKLLKAYEQSAIMRVKDEIWIL